MAVESSRGVVAVVGLGSMGLPVAGHLGKAGWTVIGCDPDPDAGRPDPPPPYRRAESLNDVKSADVVLVLVGGSAAVDLLSTPARDAIRPPFTGRTLIVCSTVAPAAMRQLHECAARSGTPMVDAPLARGAAGARDGDLLAFVGGDIDLATRVDPILRTFCSDVVRVGAAGAGQVAKLVNNVLLWTTLCGTAESLALGESLGVDRRHLVPALLLGSGRSWVMETWDRPRDLPWADADMQMALEAAANSGLDTPLALRVRDLVTEIRRDGRLAEGGFAGGSWAPRKGADEGMS